MDGDKTRHHRRGSRCRRPRHESEVVGWTTENMRKRNAGNEGNLLVDCWA